jgi:hypothetical protein
MAFEARELRPLSHERTLRKDGADQRLYQVTNFFSYFASKVDHSSIKHDLKSDVASKGGQEGYSTTHFDPMRRRMYVNLQ